MHNITYVRSYMLSIVIITRPPRKMITVCRGSEVTINCGYCDVTVLSVTWIINGTSLTQVEVLNSPLYQLNHLAVPDKLSLTALSISGTTTFRCRVHSTPNTTSRLGRVVAIGKYVSTYTVYTCLGKSTKWASILLPDIITIYTHACTFWKQCTIRSYMVRSAMNT